MMDTATATATALPTGGCNFCDIAQGVALSCGCQKFWPRRRRRKGAKGGGGGGGGGGGAKPQSTPRGSAKGKELSRINQITEEAPRNDEKPSNDGTPTDDTPTDDDDNSEDEGCRCGHHACFHSFESPISVRTQSTGRRYSLQISDTETSVRLDRSGANLTASGFSLTSGTTTERDYSEQSPSVVAARNIKGHHYHPYHPSNLSSHSSASKSNSQTTTNRGDARSEDALRAIMPTLEGIITRLDNLTVPQTSITASTSTIVPTGSTELAEISEKLSKLIEVTEKLQQSSRSHHERLETVETFGTVLEELRDKIELAEDRANEVDEKVFSFENRLDDRLESLLKARGEKRKPKDEEDGARKKRRKDPRETDLVEESQQEVKTTTLTSFTTTTSTSTSFSGTPSSKGGRAEGTTARLVSVMERIESRVVDLESGAPPTISRPWVVEAVLLPPAPLRGIWTDSASGSAGYESSNPQSVSTFSGTQFRRKSDVDGALPRSFGVNSRLYRRLNTRGFVKTLLVLGPTAYDVASAIDANFSPLLEWCQSFYAAASPGSSASQKPPPYGPWQPLRKVHKQTNLEFLKPGETEAQWTVEFLKGSCIMKGRRRVLYITPILRIHPPPYEGVTWADIKALPKTAPVDNTDTLDPPPDSEDCWTWKDTLDEPLRPPAISASPEPDSAWSSFGPFLREDERLPVPRASLSPGPLSPPVSLSARKRKPSSPLADGRALRARRAASPVATQGLTPALTATSGSCPQSSAGRGLRRQESGSGFSGVDGASWELSPRTMGWFVEHVGVLEEEGGGRDGDGDGDGVGEVGVVVGGVIDQESRNVKDKDGDNEEEVTEQVLAGEEGYGSLEN